MLRVFYLDVAYIVVSIHICCTGIMLQMFHVQARQGGAGEGGPLGRNGPCVRGNRRGAQKLYPWAWQHARSTKLHPRTGSRWGARGEAEHEDASMGSQ